MIDEASKEKIKEMFKELKNKVKIEFCYANPMHQQAYEKLGEELAELSDAVEYKMKECDANTIKIGNAEIWGFPDGYEFLTLIEGIMMAGAGVKITPKDAKKLLELCGAEIKVFVTPTCPYCPMAAVTSFEFAFLNRKIKSKVIMANEYPELASKYNVFAVPRDVFIQKVMETCTS